MADTDEIEEGGGGKKKLILLIVGALLLVGISVGVTLMLLGGDEPAAEAEAEVTEPVKGDPVYIELKPFTVNLDPQDPVGFLQVDIQILTYFSDVSQDLEKHKPLIRNNLTVLFGQQRSADLRSVEGKEALQNKVRETIQLVVDKYGSGGKVDNVFFNNFVMQ
jgi:flagellar FliL protein